MTATVAMPNDASRSMATWMYRVVAVVLVLFAAGHTFGFLSFVPATAEGMAVQHSMGSVAFPVGSSIRTFEGFYRGFGLMVTAYLIFSAVVASTLATTSGRREPSLGALAWAFFAVQVVSTTLSFRYFFPVPAILSAVAALLSGVAAWTVARRT